MTHPHLLAVHQSLSALADATTDPARMMAKRQLKAADAALKKTIDERESWLKRNWKRLDEYRDTLPVEEYSAKETRFLAMCEEYEQMVDESDRGLVEQGVTETAEQEAMAL